MHLIICAVQNVFTGYSIQLYLTMDSIFLHDVCICSKVFLPRQKAPKLILYIPITMKQNKYESVKRMHLLAGFPLTKDFDFSLKKTC